MYTRHVIPLCKNDMHITRRTTMYHIFGTLGYVQFVLSEMIVSQNEQSIQGYDAT